MATEAQSKASYRYNKKSTRQYMLHLFVANDMDIIRKLESVPSRQGYIRELIRRDIAEKTSSK